MTAPTPPMLPVDQFITWRLHLLAKLADQGAAALYATRFDLSLREWRSMAVIGCFAPMALGRVAEMANLDRGHGSRAIDALVQRGLVSRTRSKADKRGWVVALTPAGRKMFNKVYPVGEARNARLLDCLTAAEYKAVTSALDKMIDAVRAMNDEQAAGHDGGGPRPADR